MDTRKPNILGSSSYSDDWKRKHRPKCISLWFFPQALKKKHENWNF